MASPVTNFPHFSPPAGKPPSPLPPHILPPPPPHITPPPPPHNGPTVIVIIFISFGILIFLVFLAIALYCYIKKTKQKKMVQETDIIHVDENLKVKEGIVQGPHGAEAVVLEIEDDVHVVEEIKKNKQFVEGKHAKSTDNITSALEEGISTSTSNQHHYQQHNP